MTCALDGGRHFEDREAATTAVAKQSDCQGKRSAWYACLADTPAGRCLRPHDASVSTSCLLYPLPCPQHAEALMTKLKPEDHGRTHLSARHSIVRAPWPRCASAGIDHGEGQRRPDE